MDTLGYFGFIFLELIILFLSISTIVSLVLQYIPKERLNSYLSRKGPTGYFLAAALGSITPFCACSTIPLTLGLLNAGVAIGPIITFVLVSPLLNPIIVAMVLTLMGWKVCLIYFAVCFFTSLAGGWLMSVLHAERFVRKVAAKSGGSCCCGEPEEEVIPATFKGKLNKALKKAYDDLVGVFIYLVIGTAIGAVIYGYVPQDWILSIAGKGNIFAVPLAALIGVPLYIRAESAIPIGLALSQKGMSLGAVLALIIGGAGMAIPEMSMLLSIFKIRIVAAIVTLVFLTAVIGGYVFDWFLS
ncbi:MAG: permease [Victivallaceae bacterium]|nr:permease [Victivallaceae bacterium]